MTTKITCGLSVLLTCFVSMSVSQEKAQSPAAKYQRLLDDYEDGTTAPEMGARFLDLATRHPEDPVAVDALVWVLTKLRSRPEASRALELLSKDHLQNKSLGKACKQVARTPALAAETLLRSALEKSPHQAVRSQACQHLALLLDQQSSVVDQLKKEPELADQVLQYYGEDYGKHLKSLDPKQLEKKREQDFELMLKSFAEVETPDGTLGEIATKALFRIRNLTIGRIAPEIEGQDIFGKSFKLSESKGKVVVLSFWGHW